MENLLTKTVTAVIPREGISTGDRSVKIETDGFTGESCTAASQAFEQALGTSGDQELKSEYFETEGRREFLDEG